MLFLEVYGMRRSGHHAFIGWMKRNFDAKYGIQNVIYINDLMNNYSVKGNLLEVKLTEILEKKPEVVIVSYEDEFIDVSRTENYNPVKISFLRDIHNLSASRYKANTGAAMRIDDKFVDRWISQATHPRMFKYEDFLLSKEKRDAFMQSFSVENIDKTEEVNYCSNIGSSFIGRKLDTKENYLNRHKMVEIPQNLLDIINAEKVQLVRKQVGY